MIILCMWAMAASDLPLLLIANIPQPACTLTEWTKSVSRALNLELDWATFSKTIHFTSADNSSFHLNLCVYHFVNLVMYRDTMSPSLTISNTWSHSSFTLAKNWLTGSECTLRWRAFGRGWRVKTDNPLRTHSVKPSILLRLFLDFFKLMLRNFTMCVITAYLSLKLERRFRNWDLRSDVRSFYTYD